MLHLPGSIADLARYVALHGLEDLLESTSTGVALVDSGGAVLNANPAFRALMEVPSGRPGLLDLAAPSDCGTLQELLQAGPDTPPRRLRLNLRADSGFVPFDCVCLSLPSGELLLIAQPVGLTDSDEAKRLRAELGDARSALASKSVELRTVIAQADEVAHTDMLTLLPNRRLIIADLQREVTRSERYGSVLAISMLDLDNFKTVNDTFGHGAGDDLLRQVARELRHHIRQPDEIGRYGGDEFLVILPSSGAAAASEQASRLCRQVRTMEIVLHGERPRLSLSVGIAELNIHRENWQELLERADRALYLARGEGGDRWKIS